MKRNTFGRGAAVVAAVSLGFLTASCGKHEDQTTTSSVAAGTPAVEAVQKGPAPGIASAASPGSSAAMNESRVIASADSLPPEIEVSAPDSLVTPGAVVEITARGSADVSSLVLADRLGRKQPFVYDSNANVWHTFYRVPMKVTTERVELSVTATNDHRRWHRVWVFLGVDREEDEE